MGYLLTALGAFVFTYIIVVNSTTLVMQENSFKIITDTIEKYGGNLDYIVFSNDIDTIFLKNGAVIVLPKNKVTKDYIIPNIGHREEE